MMNKDIKKLTDTIQDNCHIADARYAGDYTLCVYLLKMREMYRWEQGINFKTMLTTDDVGDWLTAREGVWDDVVEQDYKALEINGKSYDAFDNDLINALIDKENLVYNAGLGIRCRPHFFIADLDKVIEQDDYTVYISGKEYARDMAAPAAMAQEHRIFVRRESLRRVIWEILDDARVAGLDNPLTRAMSFYDFEADAEAALNQMSEAEIEFVIQHEIGEVKAGKLLDAYKDENWNGMLANLASTQAEIMLRAIRDHLADSITTLPVLLTALKAGKKESSLHFYFGNMTAMRKHLAPSLVEAYEAWHDTGDLKPLENIVSRSQAHWKQLASDVASVYNNKDDADTIEALIKDSKL